MASEVHTSLQEFCDRVLSSCLDVSAIILSTGDGIPLYTAVREETFPEREVLEALERNLSQYISIAAEQAEKMGLGALKVVTSFYNNFSLVHCYMSPLVVTLAHLPDSNCGTTLDVLPELREALEPIRLQLQTVYDRDFSTQ